MDVWFHVKLTRQHAEEALPTTPLRPLSGAGMSSAARPDDHRHQAVPRDPIPSAAWGHAHGVCGALSYRECRGRAGLLPQSAHVWRQSLRSSVSASSDASRHRLRLVRTAPFGWVSRVAPIHIALHQATPHPTDVPSTTRAYRPQPGFMRLLSEPRSAASLPVARDLGQPHGGQRRRPGTRPDASTIPSAK